MEGKETLSCASSYQIKLKNLKGFLNWNWTEAIWRKLEPAVKVVSLKRKGERSRFKSSENKRNGAKDARIVSGSETKRGRPSSRRCSEIPASKQIDRRRDSSFWTALFPLSPFLSLFFAFLVSFVRDSQTMCPVGKTQFWARAIAFLLSSSSAKQDFQNRKKWVPLRNKVLEVLQGVEVQWGPPSAPRSISMRYMQCLGLGKFYLWFVLVSFPKSWQSTWFAQRIASDNMEKFPASREEIRFSECEYLTYCCISKM